ncbi:MAG TPA: DHHW family protein [Eubacteriales bacterium]|nr:DHHW family protein [Eubacteriales bacterium]
MKKSILISLVAVISVWTALALCTFLPDKASYDAERRTLAQLPKLTATSVLNGSFMSAFETYTQDQFPLRDAFRSVKSFVALKLLRQNDNNGLYMVDGQIAKLDYPVNMDSLTYALARLNGVYQSCFADTNAKLYLAIVPDKGYYLAEANGYPAMDYDELIGTMCRGLPNARYIDLTDTLSKDSFYRTDPHCKQESFVESARALAVGMGADEDFSGEFERMTALTTFYGAYYGQLALPIAAEKLDYLTNAALDQCVTWNLETDVTGGLYDFDKLYSKDPYEFFLSGSAAFKTIENPSNDSGRELVVFRDSYGSSLVPLMAECYSKITVIDLRYISSTVLQSYLETTDNVDVLFLYSALLLNYSFSLK